MAYGVKLMHICYVDSTVPSCPQIRVDSKGSIKSNIYTIQFQDAYISFQEPGL